MVFYSSRRPAFRVMYAIAGTQKPYHVSMVVRRCNGCLALLEAGPSGYEEVILLPIYQRFREHFEKHDDGVIWIRAARNLRKGEELTYDYEAGGQTGIQCRCRPGCKTIL